MTQDLSETLNQGWESLHKTFAQIVAGVPPPPTLYHFTDAAKFRKIVEGRCLWASHATSLNDAKETVLCAERSKELVRKLLNSNELDATFGENLLAFIGGRGLTVAPGVEMATSHLPCVVSFCEAVDYSEQWLHYGRDGCGIAVGFDGKTLRPSHFDLHRVDYQPASQDARIEKLVRATHGAVQGAHGSDKVTLAHMCSEWLKYLAPTMKHRSFAHEKEWRFTSTQVAIDGSGALPIVGGGLPLEFREDGARLVPYVRLPFENHHISEVVVGYSAPTDVDAMKAYLDAQGIRASVRCSDVPVRPKV